MTKTPSSLRTWHLDIGGAIVCGVLTIVGYALTIKPVAAERAQRIAMQSELTTLQAKANTIKHSQRTLADDLNTIRTQVDDSPVHLQPDNNLNVRIARIVETASNAGMQIHETQSGDVLPGEWYQTVPIRVSGRGSYSSCAGFLHQLYVDLPDVEVLSFAISGVPAGSGSTTTFQFDLVWYAAPALAAAP